MCTKNTKELCKTTRRSLRWLKTTSCVSEAAVALSAWWPPGFVFLCRPTTWSWSTFSHSLSDMFSFSWMSFHLLSFWTLVLPSCPAHCSWLRVHLAVHCLSQHSCCSFSITSSIHTSLLSGRVVCCVVSSLVLFWCLWHLLAFFGLLIFTGSLRFRLLSFDTDPRVPASCLYLVGSNTKGQEGLTLYKQEDSEMLIIVFFFIVLWL